jgi:histidinol dehydrogenase
MLPSSRHTTSMFPVVEDGTSAFAPALERACERGEQTMLAVEPAVRQIVSDVRFGGDAMVRKHAARMDGRSPTQVLYRPYDGEQALARLPAGHAAALRALAGRARRFHQHQREGGFRYEESGMLLGQRVRPARRAGICAPGGRARSAVGVLLAAIPAQVAGVTDIILATPEPDDATLAAAHLAGVTAVLDASGAHAVAALAYGTESVPRVDVIAGQGDVYVACAKRQVFGHVNVDGLGGPAELLVLADASAQPALVAADLLAVAEQDEQAWPLLLTTELRVAVSVERELARLLAGLPRRAMAEASLSQQGCALVVRTRERMLEIADRLAVGQASFHLHRAEEAFEAIRAVGSGAWGEATPGAAGAYVAGPSSVVPGVGAVRFLSALGVYHFLTRCSVVQFGGAAVRGQVEGAALLARAEGREAQARAVEARAGLEAVLGSGGSSGTGGTVGAAGSAGSAGSTGAASVRARRGGGASREGS